MLSKLKKHVAVLVALFLVTTQLNSSLAQEAEQIAPELEVMVAKPQPPMQNVFFNVLWGSLTGGMLMMGWATLDDSKSTDERYTVSHLSNQFLAGATYGGILGLAAGVYISMKGITFDQSKSQIVFMEPVKPKSVGYQFDQSPQKAADLHEYHLIKLQMKF